jgi:hypothetical protein
MDVLFESYPVPASASFSHRIPVEWTHCRGCSKAVCDYGDFVVDTDRAGRPLDVEHECDQRDVS